MTKEELQARQEKQALSVEMKRTDSEIEELRITPADHSTCKKYGFKYGAIAKFRDTQDEMISLFCDLTP